MAITRPRNPVKERDEIWSDQPRRRGRRGRKRGAGERAVTSRDVTRVRPDWHTSKHVREAGGTMTQAKIASFFEMCKTLCGSSFPLL